MEYIKSPFLKKDHKKDQYKGILSMAAAHFHLYVEIVYHGFICTAPVMHTALIFWALNTLSHFLLPIPESGTCRSLANPHVHVHIISGRSEPVCFFNWEILWMFRK